MLLKLNDKDVFALYRLPMQKDHFLVLQNGTCPLPSHPVENEFLFHPFEVNENNPSLRIRADRIIKNAQIELQIDKELSMFSTGKSDYLSLANQFIESTKSSYEKLVLSRILVIKRKNQDHFELFLKMCHWYPNAFVYLFNHPDSGTWMGASPESLVSKKKDSWTTMSLAGTRIRNEKGEMSIPWTNKEIREQALVTEYLEKLLFDRSIPFTSQGPVDHLAGELIHLRTDFEFELEPSELPEFLNELHPTPAVCGIPGKAAKTYILEQEKHDRAYYCGYLGPAGIEKQTQLFVNLRCMQISKSQFVLYLGGGITAESLAEDEWLETRNKARTMLDILGEDHKAYDE